MSSENVNQTLVKMRIKPSFGPKLGLIRNFTAFCDERYGCIVFIYWGGGASSPVSAVKSPHVWWSRDRKSQYKSYIAGG